MNITPDNIVFWQSGFFILNGTLVFTWVTMAVLVVISALVTRQLAVGPDRMSRWQHGPGRVVVRNHSRIQNQRRQPSGCPPLFALHRHPVFVHCHRPIILEIIPGIHLSRRIPIYHGSPGHLCVCGSAHLWHSNQGWGGYLKALTSQPTRVNVAPSTFIKRSFSRNCGPGHFVVWQRNEQPATCLVAIIVDHLCRCCSARW